MIDRRSMFVALTVVGGLAWAVPAAAIERKTFDPKAFEAAQASEKSILVEVTAPWCPTCKAQAAILSKLADKPKYRELVAFSVDVDTQKALLRKFGVTAQSTLISFKGSREIARSTGTTSADAIETQLDKSI